MVHLSNTLSAVVLSAILAGIFGGGAAFAYPSGDSGTDTTGLLMDLNNTGTDTASSSMYGEDMWGMMDSNKTGTMGVITGTSNDPEGNPAWLLAGHWKASYASNSTAIGSDETSGNITDFSAIIHMVMFNGSAMHMHEMSNFTQTEDAAFNSTGNSTTYVGTSTITMREGPVSDVGTRITISDTILQLEFDPTMIDNHFGDTPIYGMMVDMEMMMGWMEMHHGDMMGSWMDKGSSNTTTSSTEGYMME